LTCYDKATKESIIINQSQVLTNAEITCLSFDQADNLWVGTVNNGIFIIKKEQQATTQNEGLSQANNPQLFQGQAITKGQIITLDKVYFEADSTELSQLSIPIIQDLYQFLEGNPTVSIEVGGHTNNIPEDKYCRQLSPLPITSSKKVSLHNEYNTKATAKINLLPQMRVKKVAAKINV